MAITKVTRNLLSTGIDDQSNATAITIDSSENVGIGTTNPSSGGGLLNLETSSSSVVNYNSTNANGGYIKFQRSGTTKGYVGTPAGFLGGGDADDLGIRAQADFTVATGGANERMRIDSDGIIRAKSFRNVGHYIGPDGGVSVADDATVTVTNNVAGAMMVSIYDAGTGSGALYFVNYQGDPQVIKSSGVLSFTDDDIDGSLCIYKTGAANSHSTVFKNRTGATRTIYISVFGSLT